MPVALRSRVRRAIPYLSFVSLTVACSEEASPPAESDPALSGTDPSASAAPPAGTSDPSSDVTTAATTTAGGSSTPGMGDSAGGTSAGGSSAGVPNVGGAKATAGAAGEGGAPTMGGAAAGGATATGGASAMGGAGAGGTAPTGGASAMGGASSPGGTSGAAGNTSNDDPRTESELVGWASVSACGPNGTTGGGDGEPTVTVTSGGEFASAMNSTGPAVIEISGQINSPGELSGVRDKTILGTNGAEVRGGLVLSGARNVIFKDVVFSDGSNDTFELTGSECIWFDHCEFRDGLDGNLDIVRASDLITVSWTRFHYTRGHSHMLSNLCGNANDRPGDVGKINITFHHNWWGAGVRSRQPRVRYGQVHVFNNYYHYIPVAGDDGHVGTVAAGQYAKLLVENNYFDGSTDPIYWQSDEGTAEVVERGNEFINTNGDRVTRGASFTPPYEYTMDSGSEIKDIVMNGAGPR